MLNLLPRDEKYFDRFSELAQRIHESAKILDEFFNGTSPVATVADRIKRLEHECDEISHEILRGIDRTFITPIDREDIHMLASRLDDVIDLLDGTSRRFAMLHITEVLPPARQLSAVLLKAATEIQAAVKEMRKPIAVHQHVARIKQLEEEGDAIYHEAVGALFAGTPNALDVIKWKEMYDTLEGAIDSCMGVAQVLQSISLKNA